MDAKLAEWFAGHDTGSSSKAIALFLAGRVKSQNVPSDSDDFGRCYRLMKHMGWQDRIAEMSAASGRWAALVDIWPALIAAYEQADHKEVYRLIGNAEADGYRRSGYIVEVDKDGRVRSVSRKDGATSHRMGNVTMSWGT